MRLVKGTGKRKIDEVHLNTDVPLNECYQILAKSKVKYCNLIFAKDLILTICPHGDSLVNIYLYSKAEQLHSKFCSVKLTLKELNLTLSLSVVKN